ncbi:MAG: galactokinase [Proteobacteria bacterium]|nr:galactokinase [Pseudomonadota bacterium]MDA0914838.1 galactokinase [Pseudomonadota bacterium]MDA1032115.1 galactokinase [Pseudomonadota bacterium]
MSEVHIRVPGRVNLIGEHTDYNGGMVLPAALSVGLGLTLRASSDDQVIARSIGYDKAVRDLSDKASGAWSDPVVGALGEARKMGLIAQGADVSITSTIPAGSGLSSSAALIVAILKAAREAGDGAQSDVEIAVAARRVENEFMGVPCGIMDQMAVALATPSTAMALDTKTLEYELVQLPRTHTIAVVHSGVIRKLTEGRYAERKQECDEAKAFFGTEDLCLLDPEDVSQSSLAEIPRKRALHCATEHRRVLTAIQALKADNIAALGQAMNESHISMRYDFEMSLPEIDALVSDARKFGALGARLTGGGFGGCIVACVENDALDNWLAKLLAAHPNAKPIDTVCGG